MASRIDEFIDTREKGSSLGVNELSCQFAVIGAGPYGLAVTSHLRSAGFHVRAFGEPMGFWNKQMPKGMLLKSPWDGSHISDPNRAWTLDRYAQTRGAPILRPAPLEDFVRYGQWFQQQAVPDLDLRQVMLVVRADSGLRLVLNDGASMRAENVVVAAGIGAFAHYPAAFAGLPRAVVSHTSDPVNRDLGRFSGKRVIVVGAGQSAVELAALLHEEGADVEVLVRRHQVRWINTSRLAESWMASRFYPFKAPGRIGFIGVNWLVEHPRLFTLFPRRSQNWMGGRAMLPRASAWLRPRTLKVTFTCGKQIVSAKERCGRVHPLFDDGTGRDADHILLGTGYKVDLAKYGFLSAEILHGVRMINGYPVLDRGFQSSIPGLHFVGATAAFSFGPLCRFVHGTQYVAGAVARLARERSASRVGPSREGASFVGWAVSR